MRIWLSCLLVVSALFPVEAQDVDKPMSSHADPGIEVATIKPSDPNSPGELFTIKGRHVVTVNTNASELIKFAYGVSPSQIDGGPEWLKKDKFDIDGVADVPGIPNNAQMQVMIGKLLADRFHLVFHRERRETAVYALTLVAGGVKLIKTDRRHADSTDMYGSGGVLNVRNMSMTDFAVGLSRGLVDKPVVDQTGLVDRYDFVLKWSGDNAPTDDPNAPPVFLTAIQEQLGLKLRPAKAPVDVLVIDRMDRPTSN